MYVYIQIKRNDGKVVEGTRGCRDSPSFRSDCHRVGCFLRDDVVPREQRPTFSTINELTKVKVGWKGVKGSSQVRPGPGLGGYTVDTEHP